MEWKKKSGTKTERRLIDAVRQNGFSAPRADFFRYRTINRANITHVRLRETQGVCRSFESRN